MNDYQRRHQAYRFMMNRIHAVWLSLILIAGVALAGCGKSKSGSGEGGFGSAPPGIKAAWDKAVADDKANNYGMAFMGYRQVILQRDQLSPDQAKAAEAASAILYQRIVDAADKGDQAAKQALAALSAGTRGQAPSR